MSYQRQGKRRPKKRPKTKETTKNNHTNTTTLRNPDLKHGTTNNRGTTPAVSTVMERHSHQARSRTKAAEQGQHGRTQTTTPPTGHTSSKLSAPGRPQSHRGRAAIQANPRTNTTTRPNSDLKHGTTSNTRRTRVSTVMERHSHQPRRRTPEAGKGQHGRTQTTAMERHSHQPRRRTPEAGKGQHGRTQTTTPTPTGHTTSSKLSSLGRPQSYRGRAATQANPHTNTHVPPKETT